jgi:DNA-binding response OmpR family regulator
MHFETIRLAEIPSLRADLADKRPVVMVVDDEKVIADTLAAILARSGYTAIAAYDGESALERARTIPPQMMITDVCMPGMGGIELAVAMRRSCPACKILLFSGQMATVDLLIASRNAGYDFAAISKPIHPTELLAKVSEFLAGPSDASAPDANSPDGRPEPAFFLSAAHSHAGSA